MMKRLINKRVSCKLEMWKTKGTIALAAIAIALPVGNLNAVEVSNAKKQESIVAQADTRKTPQRRNVTADELTDRVNALVGRTVTVRGEYDRKIGDRAFAILDKDFFVAEPIIVVNISGDPLNIPSDDIKVQATGVVRNFSLEQIAKYYNMQFDRATYALYKNSPVIIARSVAPAPEPEEIVEAPNLYYGRRVAVPGDVANIYSPTVFTLEDGLLALNPNPKSNFNSVNKGEKVVATGVVGRFVIADLERDYGFTLDAGLRKQLEVEYANRPVLIVDTVYPSAVED